MSNQVLVPAGALPFDMNAVPAFLQDTASHSTLEDQQLGGSVDRITQVDGSVVVEMDGVRSNPALSINVVILDAAPRGRDTYRAYYAGTWKEGDSAPPDCYSADGRTPSPHAASPQCTACDICPKNLPGSGLNGEGRACGFFKHVAVATYPELDRVYRLKVSSRSLFSKDANGVDSPLGGKAWGFSNYAKHLQQMKTPWEGVITRISLPKGQTHGFFFTPMGYIGDATLYKQALALRDDTKTMEDILSVELIGTPASTPKAATSSPALPPPAPLAGRAKWLADATLPQNVKDWIMQVDDATALAYLTPNYPHVL